MEISSHHFDVTKLMLHARLQEQALKGTRNNGCPHNMPGSHPYPSRQQIIHCYPWRCDDIWLLQHPGKNLITPCWLHWPDSHTLVESMQHGHQLRSPTIFDLQAILLLAFDQVLLPWKEHCAWHVHQLPLQWRSDWASSSSCEVHGCQRDLTYIWSLTNAMDITKQPFSATALAPIYLITHGQMSKTTTHYLYRCMQRILFVFAILGHFWMSSLGGWLSLWIWL